MKLPFGKCPPCPKCGGKMTARDDKFDCKSCRSFYYQASWQGKSQEGWK